MGAVVFSGTNWALVRIDSGEYVAVGTNSIDSIPYLLGRPIESHATFVFRCFLRPDAVVLDIGANFGLYSAIAGTAVHAKGRVFAFEGNPRTFDLLLRTLSANHLLSRPVVWPFNLLVSDRGGRGTLYYDAKMLAGATMTDIGESGARDFAKVGLRRQPVENEMTRIDSILPSDVVVDIAKIDVEGHEPFVIRGMANTIARSPGLRFIIEYNDQFLAPTIPAAQFLNEIRELGFRVCKIQRNLRLELLGPDETPRGHFEVLLTRTPETDMQHIAAQRRRLGVQYKRWLRRTARDLRGLWYRW
jgi:FkbM family methyltransferase